MPADTKSSTELLTKAQQLLDTEKIAKLQLEQKRLRDLSSGPQFWNQPQSQEIMQQLAATESQLEQFRQLEQLMVDLDSCYLLQQESSDMDKDADIAQLLQEQHKLERELNQLVNSLQITQFLSDKFDQNQAILSIHPGQGGTEAMDWAQMLERMYQRFFERKGWKYQLLNETPGEEAGIKEVSFEVFAPFAYGYLKHERGTHRLVRLSPFNADNLRQTSFALVEVLPVISGHHQVELRDEDLNWRFTRAGGPGGQAVNKINTAVELTHLPSQITVKSRGSRSQAQNKETAIKILKAKLAMIEEGKLQQSLNQEKGHHHNASWGTQIRNYVLHPYQLVKDTRTQFETSNTRGVLDGEIDKFIEKEVRQIAKHSPR